MIAIFNQIRGYIEVALLVLVLLLALSTWWYMGKYEKTLTDNATLISANSASTALLGDCSKATSLAEAADKKKEAEVALAQKKVLGLANAQVKLAQDILTSKPKSSDLCLEGYNLLEGYLANLKKEENIP